MNGDRVRAALRWVGAVVAALGFLYERALADFCVVDRGEVEGGY